MKSHMDINLNTKLILSYIILISLPFLLSNYVLSSMSSSNIKENSITYINMFAEQISSNVDSYISELDRMTKVTMLDDYIIEMLTSETPSTNIQSYEEHQYISRFILGLTTQQPNIQTVTLVGKNGKFYTGNSNAINDLDAFEKATNFSNLDFENKNIAITAAHYPFYLTIKSNETIFCVIRQLRNLKNEYVGSIILNINCGSLLNTININPSLIESGARIVITNYDDEIIADTSPDFKDEGYVDFEYDDLESGNHILFHSTSGYSNLTSTVVISSKQIFYSTYRFRIFSFIIIFIVMVIIFILSSYFSFQLLKPIKKLHRATEEVQKGNYDIHIALSSNDEIGQLSKSFNLMIERIKDLMQRVYLTQIQTKQAQLEALQNQINPHFLHNTLETIRMKAVINGDKEVAVMIKNLAKLFKITLDRKQNVVALCDELEHVKAYMAIQNMRYNNRFHLQLDISNELLTCAINKLTLQPIVENCIVHGFSKTFPEETILIQAVLENDCVYINIIDNGKGMNSENLKRIQDKIAHKDTPPGHAEQHSSIGIINVADRITLEFGKDYFLKIDNNCSRGTIVSIKIPHTDLIFKET